MKLLGTALVFSMLVALACGRADDLRTPEPPSLDVTVQAVVSETQIDSKATAEIDIEATINARVQATVRALLKATPIPSPTPTQGIFHLPP